MRKELWEGGVHQYIRDSGHIRYVAQIFNIKERLFNLPNDLLSTGLAFCWMSLRYKDLANDSPVKNLPTERPWTLITENNGSTLIDDFREQNVDEEGRSILIVGANKGAEATLLDPDVNRKTIKAFEENEEGSIQITLHENGDGYPVIFVPHQPRPIVTDLLEKWGITPESISEIYYCRKRSVNIIKYLYNILFRQNKKP